MYCAFSKLFFDYLGTLFNKLYLQKFIEAIRNVLFSEPMHHPLKNDASHIYL
jgi:hypothetical protein